MSKRIIIDLYCRISKDYDGTLRAVEDQEALGRAWIAEHAHEGYVLGRVFRDHALSGWNPKVSRPDWEECMTRLETGAAQGVWVRDLDRFTRKLAEAERLLIAAEAGALVIAGHSSYDFSTARGKRGFREDAVDAAYESDRISERSSRGKRSKVARGKSNASKRGFARPGYLPNAEDWEPGEARVEVPADQLAREVAAVRDAVDRLLAGETLAAIARGWNDAGLLTLSGCRWDGGMLRQMLVAPSMAGYLATRDAKGKWTILGQAPGEPVIDPAKWDRLMLNFASRKRGRPATEYLLSGILTCGKCGSYLYGRPVVAHSPYEDGQVRRQYWCQVRVKEGGCGTLTIDQRFADAVVTEQVLLTLQDPRHADRVARVAAKVEAAQRAITKELSDLNAEADAVTDKIGQPGWTVARVDAALAKFAPLIEDAAKRLKDLGEVPDGGHYEDAAKDWADASITMRREMVRKAFPEGLHVTAASSRGRAALLANRIVPGTYPGTYPKAS
jgi:site-specific DNA recombinase